MTVQKYRPSAKELANDSLWHPAIGSEINKQVCIGKYVVFAHQLQCTIAINVDTFPATR
jgi:hypothetical protein